MDHTSDFNLALAVRFLSMEMVEAAQSGHPGMPMGMADVVTVLYKYFLKFNPEDPHWPNRDRFILSAGHGSALLYAILYLTGYKEIDLSQLKQFRQLGSKTAGHPEYNLACGIETTTGPLGQGLANAVGMALTGKVLNAEYGDQVINHKIYVVVGDGCLAEGISQEAISFAGHLGLNNLIVLFDDNGITIDGPTSLSTSDDHLKRFSASNWNVLQINGHDYPSIVNALEQAQYSDKPIMIACKTKIGFGSPAHEGKSTAHGSPLGKEEIEIIKEKFHWKSSAFDTPEQILNEWRSIAARNHTQYQEWVSYYNSKDNNTESLKNYLTRKIPLPFEKSFHALKLKLCSEPKISESTRQSSGRVVELMSKYIPNILGGSADLTPSNNTKSHSLKAITTQEMSGRYLHYGIREHGMAAIMNGIALSGAFIPYGGTFLAFSDYCRPAIRLSALMGLRVIYIMTHDSIALGEDGPTHQPVEHLAALRAIPNLYVFRPCDVVETLECWSLALHKQHAPSILALSRQSLPQLRRYYTKENLCARGAYIIKPTNTAVLVSIFATGSEVSLAMEVASVLEDKGIDGVQVISVPCMDLFKTQDRVYQASLLNNSSFKVAIEAGIAQGWGSIIGNGLFIGMDSFGASGKTPELLKHFGFDAKAIAGKIKKHL